MYNYNITQTALWEILELWDRYLPQRLHLVACGGTALTIQGVKPSTKDVDLMVPIEKEYVMLIQTLRRLGYKQTTGTGWSRGDGFFFDLFLGNQIFTTELLESPLKKGNHTIIKKFKKVTVSALNDYDLIISKMFRGTEVDLDDCGGLIRFRGKKFDLKKLQERYQETTQYEIQEKKVLQNLEKLLGRF